MVKMTPDELRKSYIDFMKRKGASQVPSAGLLPENDPSTLFTGSGMQPMVPYLLGEKHPIGNEITNIQKCLRTVDIDEVGDTSHLTFLKCWADGNLKQMKITIRISKLMPFGIGRLTNWELTPAGYISVCLREVMIGIYRKIQKQFKSGQRNSNR